MLYYTIFLLQGESDGGDNEEEPEGEGEREREGEGEGEGEGGVEDDDVTVGVLRWTPGKIRPGKKGSKIGITDQ